MQVADPYYRDGATVRRDKVQELLDTSPYIKKGWGASPWWSA